MRRCTILYLEHGLLYREIAELMELSLGAVKAHLSQARVRLKSALVEAFGLEEPRREDSDGSELGGQIFKYCLVPVNSDTSRQYSLMNTYTLSVANIS